MSLNFILCIFLMWSLKWPNKAKQKKIGALFNISTSIVSPEKKNAITSSWARKGFPCQRSPSTRSQQNGKASVKMMTPDIIIISKANTENSRQNLIFIFCVHFQISRAWSDNFKLSICLLCSAAAAARHHLQNGSRIWHQFHGWWCRRRSSNAHHMLFKYAQQQQQQKTLLCVRSPFDEWW